MAEYCRTMFGDTLLTEPLEKFPVSAVLRGGHLNLGKGGTGSGGERHLNFFGWIVSLGSCHLPCVREYARIKGLLVLAFIKKKCPRQENLKFHAIWGCIVRPYLKQTNKNQTRQNKTKLNSPVAAQVSDPLS